eukprot:TRINITY_DN5493_c0_g3_i2.p1 TRINITY_DN5493_c0_g3~~TRINITY_DN5493_c0_g3_i2.p1  ORF type:complete len:635 (+),score=178.71 TRINITY_DN5493_c0_g3_i2:117-2021(+)
MATKFDEVLQRAERLIQSCETWPPERWPPERPPISPQLHPYPPLSPVATEAQSAGAYYGHLPTSVKQSHPAPSPWPSSSPVTNEAAAACPEPATAGSMQQSRHGCQGGHQGAVCGGSPSPVYQQHRPYGAETPMQREAAGNTPPPVGVGATPGAASSSSVLGASLKPADAAVLIDGLERENALLRQQLERSIAREKALKSETDELKKKLEQRSDQDAGASGSTVESESLRKNLEKQGAMAEVFAAKLEALQGEHDTQDTRLAALQAELSTAQADVDGLTKEIEGIRHFVLPNAPVDVGSETAVLGSTMLQVSVQRSKMALGQLRLACEAKFETFGLLHRQLRSRLEAASSGAPNGSALAGHPSANITAATNNNTNIVNSNTSTHHYTDPQHQQQQQQQYYQQHHHLPPSHNSTTTIAPPPPPPPPQNEFALGAETTDRANAMELQRLTAAAAAETAKLREELNQAKLEIEREKQRGDEALKKLNNQEDGQLLAAKEVESARRALRVREAEVRELQLISKYFANREKPPTPQELEVAELAEELRKQCSRLQVDLDQIRAERDLLRAERDRAERQTSLTAHSTIHGPGSATGAELAALENSTNGDLAMALKILEQKKVLQSSQAAVLSSSSLLLSP